jgi:hypothetical protein
MLHVLKILCEPARVSAARRWFRKSAVASGPRRRGRAQVRAEGADVIASFVRHACQRRDQDRQDEVRTADSRLGDGRCIAEKCRITHDEVCQRQPRARDACFCVAPPPPKHRRASKRLDARLLAMTALILGTNCRVGGLADLNRGISDGSAKATMEDKRQVVRA